MLLEGLLLLYSSFLFHRARRDVVSGWVIMLVYARRGLSFRPLFRIVAHIVLALRATSTLYFSCSASPWDWKCNRAIIFFLCAAIFSRSATHL